MIINAEQSMHKFSDKSQQGLLGGLCANQVDHDRVLLAISFKINQGSSQTQKFTPIGIWSGLC